MASPREAAEAGVIVFSLGLFVCYHTWLFLIRGRGTKVSPTYGNFFEAGKLARSLWAEACASDEKDAILGVQQARNAMTACSYLATISVALATAGITIVFDDQKIERIRQLAINDPIMRHLEGPPVAPPTAILSAALGSLYLSFVLLTQSQRLWVHTGFYIRAVTSRFNPGTLTVCEAKRAAVHAGFAFSLGLRLFYFFIPLVMWSIGATSLLISSVVMTAVVASMDHFERQLCERPSAAEGAEEAPLAQQQPLVAPLQPAPACGVDAEACGGAARHQQQQQQQLLRSAGRGGSPGPGSGSRRSTAQELGDEYLASMV